MPPTQAVDNNNNPPPADHHQDVGKVLDVQSQSHVTGEINAARSTATITPESVSIAQFVNRFNSMVDANTGAIKPDVLQPNKLYQVTETGMPLSLSPGNLNDMPPPNGRQSAGTDGTVVSNDKGNDAGDQGAGNKHGDVNTERNELLGHINDKSNGLDSQQQKLMTDSIDTIMNNKNLTDDQKAALLRQANRMFDEQDRIYAQGIDQTTRNEAVTGMLYDTAHPEAENQGQHNTCNGTTIGKIETMEDPVSNAQRIADMFTNANGDHTVTMPDGFKVHYDVNSLKHTQESDYALTQQGMGSGARDAFVQAMNHLYINDMTQRKGLYYTQERSGQYGQSDTGERLHVGGFDGQTVGANGKVGGIPPESSPAISGDDIAQELQHLGAQSALLANKSHFGITDGSVDNITTVDQLNAAWDANGGKPMIAAVDTRAGIFQPNGEVGGAGGGHVVVVDGRQQVGTDANGKPVYEYHIANSWGSQYNGWVTSNDLVNAMDPTTRVASAQNDGRGLQPTPGGSPQPGSDGAGLPRPQQGGNAPAGWANYDTTHSGVQRSDNGIVPNFDTHSANSTMTSDQVAAWYKHYQEQLQQQRDDEERQAMLRRLAQQAQAAGGSDQGGG